MSESANDKFGRQARIRDYEIDTGGGESDDGSSGGNGDVGNFKAVDTVD